MEEISELARVCVICERSLEYHRPQAVVCNEICGRERRRLLAILDGRGAPPYRSVRARVQAANNPANGATGGPALRPRPRTAAPRLPLEDEST